MDWQFATTCTVIALATSYFAWVAYRTWQSAKTGGCGGTCGCAKTAKPEMQPNVSIIPVEQLTLRVRR